VIRTLLWVGALNLLRDRVSLVLAFLLPVVFFSVFALIFSGGQGVTSRVKVAIVDEDDSEASRRFVAALGTVDALRIRRDTGDTRAEVLESVSRGLLNVAVIVPRGFADSIGNFSGTSPETGIELLADTADPVAPQLVAGLIQHTVATAMPDVMIEAGLREFTRHAGPLTQVQEAALQVVRSQLRLRPGPSGSAGPSASRSPAARHDPEQGQPPVLGGLAQVRIIDVLGRTKANPIVAFFAAGTAVMFLLFSASGVGASLLEEEEGGTMQRLLSSRITMGGILAAKWTFATTMGCLQLSIMFLWAALVFRLELFSAQRLSGFAVMSLTTAAAAASFGILFATLCRTRMQLAGLSTIVILMMSAIGGSMVPRFRMTEWMQTAGMFTFNAWALDGFQKVFWYELPFWSLWPQATVLISICGAFLLAARLLARRWEAV
jgi:ABC-2 type transport system permease protein